MTKIGDDADSPPVDPEGERKWNPEPNPELERYSQFRKAIRHLFGTRGGAHGGAQRHLWRALDVRIHKA